MDNLKLKMQDLWRSMPSNPPGPLAVDRWRSKVLPALLEQVKGDVHRVLEKYTALAGQRLPLFKLRKDEKDVVMTVVDPAGEAFSMLDRSFAKTGLPAGVDLSGLRGVHGLPTRVGQGARESSERPHMAEALGRNCRFLQPKGCR